MGNRIDCVAFIPIEFAIRKDGNETWVTSVDLPSAEMVQKELEKKDVIWIYERQPDGTLQQIPNPFQYTN